MNFRNTLFVCVEEEEMWRMWMNGNRVQKEREPLAILGMGCRFPGGAETPRAFWQLLLDGINAVGEIPPERWDNQIYYHPDPLQPGKTYSRRAGLLTQIDRFDAAFFGIPLSEAA